MTIDNETQPRFMDEPWEEPVGLAELLADIQSTLKRFVILSDEQALAIALWVIHTYFIKAPEEPQLFEHSPILFITSPEKQCGKSTLRECIQRLVSNPFDSMNATQASIFRVIEAIRPTLLLDEFDNFEIDRKSLIGILNSGYKPDGKVTRQGGKNFEQTHSFSTWCPKVLAGIGHLPSTLQSRCITIKLRRKFIHERVERRNTVLRSTPSLFDDLRRKIVRMVYDHEEVLLQTDYSINIDLDDRAQDNWFGLFKLARFIDEDALQAANEAALTLSVSDDESQTERTQILKDLRDFGPIHNQERVRSSDMLSYLTSIEDSPWKESNGRPLTGYKMSSLLKPFGIRSELLRIEDKVVRGYRTSAIIDAFSRYL